ncbi:hypothetical protein M8C21_017164 [Ambrosia artemisiifolia]|uniref:Uncharacterized protein n=1 Tax=Ambrosia artemisiifolia TaxID=4212 RepID=A0AAD5CCZ0_AMBAR|nr:hypothetical protein M8C21_017164 [Ambrosia artemisiifolia]
MNEADESYLATTMTDCYEALDQRDITEKTDAGRLSTSEEATAQFMYCCEHQFALGFAGISLLYDLEDSKRLALECGLIIRKLHINAECNADERVDPRKDEEIVLTTYDIVRHITLQLKVAVDDKIKCWKVNTPDTHSILYVDAMMHRWEVSGSYQRQ